MLALQGLRQIEAVRLNVEDFDLVNGLVWIQGKDDKELIYLHPETVRGLRNYIREVGIGSGALFKSLSK